MPFLSELLEKMLACMNMRKEKSDWSVVASNAPACRTKNLIDQSLRKHGQPHLDYNQGKWPAWGNKALYKMLQNTQKLLFFCKEMSEE